MDLTNLIVLSQCGSSTTARKQKEDARREAKGLTVNPQPWERKGPYDFTGCLAHIDLTYNWKNYKVIRITGVIKHGEACQKQQMTRLPPVPLHPHVYQIAMQQANEGAR